VSQASEEIVEAWLKEKGYFIMRNIRLKRNKEIDFLAIHLEGGCEPLRERCHIEVQASPYSRAISKPYWPPESYADWLVRRKFEDDIVKAEVTKRLGNDYQKVLVLGSYGRTKPSKEERNKLIKEIERRGVKVIKFEDVLNQVQKSLGTGTYAQPSLRILQYFKFMKNW